MSDIKSFIEELKQLNEKDCFNVYVPSLKKPAKFRAFSVKQHKDIVKSLLDGVEGGVSMYKVFGDIILENSIDDIEFTLYDKNKILVDLRRQCISPIIKIDDNEYDLNTLPQFRFDFDISRTFKYNNVVVVASVPSLVEDLKITEKSILEFNKAGLDDKKLGSSINILLAYELIKFIDVIEIDGNALKMKELGVYDRKNIIENLPLKLNNDILEYIAHYKEYEQNMFTFPDDTKLTIDASFLSAE